MVIKHLNISIQNTYQFPGRRYLMKVIAYYLTVTKETKTVYKNEHVSKQRVIRPWKAAATTERAKGQGGPT